MYILLETSYKVTYFLLKPSPVAKEWKFNMDEPKYLVEEAVKRQEKLIKVLKEVPGLKKSRFDEALVPKHVALSLVSKISKINRLESQYFIQESMKCYQNITRETCQHFW
jgi:hypothetical protein